MEKWSYFPPYFHFFKSAYATHNLHINIILYCHWLKVLHHLRSIWRHLLRARTNCNNELWMPNTLNLSWKGLQGNQYWKARLRNIRWHKLKPNRGIIQCAANPTLLLSSQRSASCVAFLICAESAGWSTYITQLKYIPVTCNVQPCR